MSDVGCLGLLCPDGDLPLDDAPVCHASSESRFLDDQSACINFSSSLSDLIYFSHLSRKRYQFSSSLIIMSVIAEPKLFGKWSYEDVQCSDLSLKVCHKLSL